MNNFKFMSFLNILFTILHNGSPKLGYALLLSHSPSYPKQIIAGVGVIDTPLVRDARKFAQEHSSNSIYNDMIWSWLLGALIIGTNETLRNIVDLEVHAVASLFHNVGLDPALNSPIVSHNRRFEVDGATAATNFIKNHDEGKLWDEQRVQLVWDAIALHATFGIADYKELEVQIVSKGASMDFEGPGLGVTKENFTALSTQFPRGDFKKSFNSSIIWLCQNKPNTTYDTWMQPWGDRYVADYNSKENDLIEYPFID